MQSALLISFCLLCLAYGVRARDNYYHGLSNYTFPSNFIFGVSTAAFQIEGAWNVGGKGESMWDTFLHENPSYTPDSSNADIAADSYHKYMEDIEMIKALGVRYYRMSISWPRLLPNGTDDHISIDGIRYYRTLFNELIKANITPIVTLFHWDMPTPLMDLGGWSNPVIVDFFEDYARVAFEVFGDLVKLWTTINEPHQHCANGYGLNFFAPALNSHGIGDYLCNHYILLSHARVYHLYKNDFAHHKGKIGITLDAFWAEPKNISSSEDHEAVERYLQMHLGLYAHPIFSKEGNYPASVRQIVDTMSFKQGFTRSRLPYFSAEEVDLLRGSSDFFGLNHYTTYLMSPSDMEPEWLVPSIDHDAGVRVEQNLDWPKPGVEWLTVYPPGFRRLLNWINKNYGPDYPILITENGMSDFEGLEDYDRVSYYNKYLYQLLLAIYQDGCNVKGYFAWTLMDDFEWKDGYTAKFGLFHVDFDSPERTRTAKLSAYNYAEIVKTHQINFESFRPRDKLINANHLNL